MQEAKTKKERTNKMYEDVRLEYKKMSDIKCHGVTKIIHIKRKRMIKYIMSRHAIIKYCHKIIIKFTFFRKNRYEIISGIIYYSAGDTR